MSTELLSDLLFCLRAAIQGTRQIESVNNGAAEMGQLFVDLNTTQAENILRERRRYAQGNLYYAVTINSIEVIGYLRCFYKVFINQSSTILNNEDSILYDTENATLYQFYCLLRQTVCSLLGEERMQSLWNHYQNECEKTDFIPYEYEFLNYLKNSFLYHSAAWSTQEIESAIFSLALLQCQTLKSDVLACVGTNSIHEYLKKMPDCAAFPALYDSLAARSKDGQVYMDEVFPGIDKYLTAWENVCR